MTRMPKRLWKVKLILDHPDAEEFEVDVLDAKSERQATARALLAVSLKLRILVDKIIHLETWEVK